MVVDTNLLFIHLLNLSQQQLHILTNNYQIFNILNHLSLNYLSLQPHMIRTFIKPFTPLFTLTLTHIPKFLYHMSYLMDSRHDDRYVKIDRNAFHLYKDLILKLNKHQFNQKIFVLVLIDCVRIKQKYSDFLQLAQFGISKIHQFKEIISVFSFVTQLYLYNYPNKQLSYKVAQRGFQLLKQLTPENAIGSFYKMKFLIFVQKCVGLSMFPNQVYAIIDYKHFKPLFLSFVLEMFYKNRLEHYPFLQDIIDLFTQKEDIIPFSDLHHYLLIRKIINHPKFIAFVQNLQKKTFVNSPSDIKSDLDNLQDPQVVQEQIRSEFQQEEITTKNIAREDSQKNKTQTKKRPQFPWTKTFDRELQKRFTYFPS